MILLNTLCTVTWKVDPIAFHIGSLEIRWYGILLATGFLLAYYTLQQIFKTEKLSQKLLDKISIWTIVWTIIGLRLGHFLFYEPEQFIINPLEILLPFKDGKFVGYQGLASHGAVIAIFGFIIYYCWKHKINFFWLLDRLGIAIPIAASFVRIGNLMNHEIVGSITNVPWAFNFIYGGLGVEGTFRHPAQLYESAVYMLVFIGLAIYYFKFAKGKVAAGRTAGITLTVIFLARFIIEFFKEVQVQSEIGHALNNGQILSIPLVLVGLGLLIYSFVKPNYPTCPYKEEPDAKVKSSKAKK
ncbi:MAG: prolipoprotein diacylglyceryl transferase [Bacteroidales bacterium]|nr:prolipoprotein diacylglyceryl transferase [Bacteroidales bacterium]